jgi:hypothetical protein
MTTGYKTYKLHDFIKKTPAGEFDLDRSIKLIRELATAACVHDDHSLLIDLRQSTTLNSFVDLLTLATEFTKYIHNFSKKIAFILPNDPDRIIRADFFLKSLDNHAFSIKYFTEYEQAIDWLSTVKKYPGKNT